MMYSYILVFGRDSTGQFAKGAGLTKEDLNWIKLYKERYVPEHLRFQLHHFQIYGPRLRYILDTMDEWQPQTIPQLAIRPYKDPLSFYGFWFATIIGLIGIVGLGTSIAQTYASFKSLSP